MAILLLAWGSWLVVAPASIAQTSAPSTSQPSSPSVDTRTQTELDDALAEQFRGILAAAADRDQAKLQKLIEPLRLPNSKEWFTDTFGEEKGAKLAAKYDQDSKVFFAGFDDLMLRLPDPGNWKVSVVHVDQIGDPKAKSLQMFALAAMKDPVPLYTVSLTRPGTKSSVIVWSLVYVDGSFHWLGKMEGVKG